MIEGRKRLLVVRHAKSSWHDPGLDDHDRPLAPRGRKALPRLRDHLAAVSPPPDLVLCSSSRRTRETLEGIRSVLDARAVVEVEASLYGADSRELLRRLRRIDGPAACAVLIGHNPGVEDLIDLLVDPRAGGVAPPDRFPTGAVASLSVPGRWDRLRPDSAVLEQLWTPRHGLR